MEDNKSLPTDTLTSGPTSTTFVISHGILFCCLAAFTVAAMCLLGWMLEIDALKRTVPGSVYMNPATASLILLISIAIYLSSKFEGRYTTVLKVSGALALFVGIAKLSNGIFGLDLGIDRLVFSGQLFDKILQQPSQMSQLSAMIIAMFGTALILHRSEKPDRWHLRSVVQILAVVVHLTAMLGLISFLYGVRTFHLVFTIDPMALHSSICFAVLSIGLLLSQPDKGVMEEILSRDVGGEMTRRIMLPVLLTPPSLGFLLLAGFKLQMFSPEIGIALFVIVTVVILMVVILTNAYAMNQQARTRRVAEVALEVAMRREALIVEHALDVICTLDENGRFLTVNPACRRLLGYEPDELIGRHHLEFIHPDDIEKSRDDEIRILSGEITSEFENRYVHRDGSLVDVSWTARWSEAERLMFCVARDVTERRKLQQELEDANRLALESSRLKSEFLANMSHEIRTPMNGVIGMAELLLATSLDEKQKYYTESVAASAEMLLKIIDDILDFSKIEAGKLRFDKTAFDLREAVEQAVEVLAERAQAKGVEIASVVYFDIPSQIKGDADRLRQVLINLLGNAVKFTQIGEILVSVKKHSETNSHVTLKFQVRDTGIGISSENQRRLFEPFVQTDGTSTRKFGGTGLGLAISRQLVEMMGGDIGVESTPGLGSKFWFAARFEKQLDDDQIVDYSTLSGAHILIVDDNPTNRAILCQQAASWGTIVTEADCASEALKSLQNAAVEKPFDIALVDLYMPGTDGIDLACQIKADPNIADVDLVLLPSHGKLARTEIPAKACITEILPKPVRQSQLYNCILKIMTRRTPDKKKPGNDGVTSRADTSVKPSPNSFGARVLVAEDNEINREVALNQLKSLGYAAAAVCDGREAVEAVKTGGYDIVFMDCQMPNMDGYEATAEIRRIETDKAFRTTIVAMTAHALKGERERCLMQGMDDYLSKPVKMENLRRVLAFWSESRCANSPDLSIQMPPEVAQKPDQLDLSVIASLRELQCPGESDLLGKLSAMFIEDTTRRIALIRAALDERDISVIQREVHSIKGAAGNLGVTSVMDLSRAIEREAENGNALGGLIDQLEDGFHEAAERLTSLCVSV